jgi:homospermidine synthase
MTFPVEVVLKGRDFAVTESVSVPHGDPSTWDDEAVRAVLVETLRALDRVQNPTTWQHRSVVLQGFSWIVEPVEGGVVIAIEIPAGAVVAGPFAIAQTDLDAMVGRVLRAERAATVRTTVH